MCFCGVAIAQSDYVVGPQDVLAVIVFGEPELSGKYTVELDGTFTFPPLGRVKAGGSTLRSLEQELKKLLADGYLKYPQVAVAVDTYRSQRILVLGEVRLPGEYQLNGDTTLLAALARAGGPTVNASREVVIIRAPRPVREPESGDQLENEIFRVDLNVLEAGDFALNPQLRDGDTINVPRARSVFVTGQVKSPGAYAIDRGTTILQLLSLAGGVTERGAAGRVRVLRTVKGKKTELRAKLTDVVEPGDTVVVPEKFF